MRTWLKKICGLRESRRGQTTAEYAIIVALVAVSSIAIILLFGNQIRNLFSAETKRLAGDDVVPVDSVTIDQDSAEGSLKEFR